MNKSWSGLSHLKNHEQYLDYIIDVKPLSLRGDTVSSHQECLIANFLYEKGVRYEYEWPYEIEVSDAQHRQYRPDFFLPDYELYIEHYGISRNGETRGDIDAAAYRASMEWKRELHAANGTRCIETFSYEATEGTLLEGLDARLREVGVAYNPLTVDELLELLKKPVGSLHLIHLFVSLYRYTRSARSPALVSLSYTRGTHSRNLH
jgi:DNA helicase-4